MKNGRYEEGGSVLWYKDDVVHRLDGPAVVHANGDKWWFDNDQLHRLSGPAIECADGTKFWFVNGQEVDIVAIFGKEPSVPLSDAEQMLLLLSH